MDIISKVDLDQAPEYFLKLNFHNIQDLSFTSLQIRGQSPIVMFLSAYNQAVNIVMFIEGETSE